eukprot:12416056-Karenia_brevis.AAC.1
MQWLWGDLHVGFGDVRPNSAMVYTTVPWDGDSQQQGWQEQELSVQLCDWTFFRGQCAITLVSYGRIF